MQPRFITFEGGEGTGKTTQIKLLAEALQRAGINVITTREPGGSKGGEAIRQLVVSGNADRWQPATEALLFMAARLDHVETVIKPALANGNWVLCDRFFDSTLVYQGIAKHVGVEWLRGIYHQLLGNFAPDLTLLLDMDPAAGLKRATARGNKTESRFESMGLEYHRRIREGFLSLAKAHGERIRIIDASASRANVHEAIITTVRKRFDVHMNAQQAG